MSRLFRNGGPAGIRFLGGSRYSAEVSLPEDPGGLQSRECPEIGCSPGFFKVKCGTGIINQTVAYCPYCRRCAEPKSFVTREQMRYARDLVTREAVVGAQRLTREILGLDGSGRRQLTKGLVSVRVEMKSNPVPLVRRPLHEELRRDVTCPHCGLYHSVYGLATWCADCGVDIFLTHIEAEFAVVAMALSDVDRRCRELGPRIAAKDLENCLEDVVSVHEAVLRVFARRLLSMNGEAGESIDGKLKRFGNGFQNVSRGCGFFDKELSISLIDAVGDDGLAALGRTFHKRHPITHNLGVIDRKYLEQSQSAGSEGKEVRVSAQEITMAIEACMKMFSMLQEKVTGLISVHGTPENLTVPPADDVSDADELAGYSDLDRNLLIDVGGRCRDDAFQVFDCADLSVALGSNLKDVVRSAKWLREQGCLKVIESTTGVSVSPTPAGILRAWSATDSAMDDAVERLRVGLPVEGSTSRLGAIAATANVPLGLAFARLKCWAEEGLLLFRDGVWPIDRALVLEVQESLRRLP